MASIIRTIKAAREGSSVKRCHTTPHIGEYTVGKHSFDALCLLMFLHPDPSMNLIKALMFHDLGERWVGDMPATAKMINVTLGKEYEAAEALALMGVGIPIPSLTEEENNWLQALDKLELYFWAREQLYMGNQCVRDYVTVLSDWFELRDKQGKLPAKVREAYDEYSADRLLHQGGVR